MTPLYETIGPGGFGEFFLDLGLAPAVETVRLGKTNFGLLAVRVAKTMGVSDGGGKIVDSEGRVGEKEILWRRARWCDYSGPAAPGGVVNGIALFDHPRRRSSACGVEGGVSLCRAGGGSCGRLSDVTDSVDPLEVLRFLREAMRHGAPAPPALEIAARLGRPPAEIRGALEVLRREGYIEGGAWEDIPASEAPHPPARIDA